MPEIVGMPFCVQLNGMRHSVRIRDEMTQVHEHLWVDAFEQCPIYDRVPTRRLLEFFEKSEVPARTQKEEDRFM